ncbi:nitrite reductase large subunit NirB [Candidatus Nitrotoga fabula]|uniref:Nitrite reductase (NAD(P)H) n=1 Tax=Candidatus Nitrotoga fabula TaxID=2182327 RepID=A0A916FAW2_9PROT|nr:nitrite reductase large subunit NirB [Candidatus Nitrotoga fabula]CAE6711822.1 Nitrite reductase (NAD(P)H) [Candidatus Nitrotoga fabula]
MKEKMKLVMVGNGMAGVRALEELLKLAPDLYEITVFGAEPYPNYNRIMLSPVLAGEQGIQNIILNDLDWYRKNNITLHLNRKVVRIDRKSKTVTAEDGMQARYDRLLLATGSIPFILPVPGKEMDGVIGYRDIEDTNAMIAASEVYRNAVVIGGGLLGLEAANGLALRGMDVSVVHIMPWLMERQLDVNSARMLQAELEARGLKFLFEKQTRELVDDGCGRVRSVRFHDGSEIPADLVVMAVGIRPNTALAESAGIYCNRGIVVNDTMQTFDPSIYAVGECVSHRGTTYGLVAPLFDMARVCANHLACMGYSSYQGTVTATKLKVTGIDLFSAGNFTGSKDTNEIVMQDVAGGKYKKLVLQEDKLVGAVMYGDTKDSSWYLQMIRDGKNVAEIRDGLLFGQSHLGNSGSQGQNLAATMTDGMEVCGCNGICKGKIVRAIKEQGLFTLDEVRKHTKASASCGSCTGLVEQILASTIGGAYAPQSSKVKPLCDCTSHSHEEVRKAIREEKLTSIPQTMSFLNWNTENGCAKCRPALNYYLLCAWPHVAVDDPQSRFINERASANIQKDGTFSVVPRIYGGITSPGQLRRIADVAEKYSVPMIKVTGGQRIDLLGIRKADLPKVWADLDMPSGYAYGKALRTVKTCVGSEWCRFGVQDSTQMGISIERAFDHMWMPHKFKVAVSGCPRNCAESGIKDVGIIGVDSGWEIYVAGNGGIKTVVGQFLVKVQTREEVLEYTGAFAQLYREEAHYLDRSVHYVERVGMDHVKKHILENTANRKALYGRLVEALKGASNPWAKENIHAYEFEPLTVGSM